MRPEKKAIYNEVKGKLNPSVFVILADYKGMSVAKTTELRRRLGEANANLQVVKNRIFQKVVQELGYQGFDAEIKGPSAMVSGTGDVVQAAKVIKEFIKEHKLPVVKFGALSGAILTADDVEKLASLPSRELLLGKLVGTLAAPMVQLAGVMQQKAASLLHVLNATIDKKSK